MNNFYIFFLLSLLCTIITCIISTISTKEYETEITQNSDYNLETNDVNSLRRLRIIFIISILIIAFIFVFAVSCLIGTAISYAETPQLACPIAITSIILLMIGVSTTIATVFLYLNAIAKVLSRAQIYNSINKLNENIDKSTLKILKNQKNSDE